jgi:hypothetical protein
MIYSTQSLDTKHYSLSLDLAAQVMWGGCYSDSTLAHAHSQEGESSSVGNIS